MAPTFKALPFDDLDYIFNHTKELWEALRNQQIFITGGTGFFGCWLLESFVWANRKLDLNANAVVLTRNIKQFARKCPHLFSEPSLVFHVGDVSNFKYPQGHFSFIIHAATEVSAYRNTENHGRLVDTIVQGTRHILDFAKQCGAKGILLTSSGAVYGNKPGHASNFSEEDACFSVNRKEPKSVYAEGKRKAEEICAQYARHYNLNIKIARCFAFVGPHLPLDTHFAIGNFIYDGLNGHPIKVTSDGSAYRSYLYAADLAIWLWTILFQGKTMRPYNVGSDESLTIKDLAYLVADCFGPKTKVHLQQIVTKKPIIERYVPDTSRAKEELGLTLQMSLAQAVLSTVRWYAHLRDNYNAN